MTPQDQATAKNGLWLNSKSDKKGLPNETTIVNLRHRHSYTDWGTDTSSGSNTIKAQYTQYGHTDYQLGDHSHEIFLDSDDIETRPVNFTYRIWKRIN